MRNAPRSTRLARIIKTLCREIAVHNPEGSLTTVGFGWQRVTTFHGESLLGATDLFYQLSKNMCWRAVIYAEPPTDSLSRFYFLEVGGGEIYVLTISKEHGTVLWERPDPHVEVIIRGVLDLW